MTYNFELHIASLESNVDDAFKLVERLDKVLDEPKNMAAFMFHELWEIRNGINSLRKIDDAVCEALYRASL